MNKTEEKSYEDLIANVVMSEKEKRSNVAIIKLLFIIKALNGEWVPDFSDWSQPKYFIYSQYLYSVIFGGSANYGSSAGFGCSYTTCAPSYAYALIGSRLCLKSRKDTEFVIDHFPELLKDYFMVDQ